MGVRPQRIEERANTMSSSDTDKVFSGSIAKLYEMHLVPLIFEPYAADLANRLAGRPLTRVLEIAAGTGVVTRALASVLPDSVSIVATSSAFVTAFSTAWAGDDVVERRPLIRTFVSMTTRSRVIVGEQLVQAFFGEAVRGGFSRNLVPQI